MASADLALPAQAGGPLPHQQSLPLGDRPQSDYDFVLAAIERHEAAVEEERRRQADRAPYRPGGRYGAFTETDLVASDAARLTSGELRVWLVHILEFGGRSHHTTAATIVAAKASASRNVYESANRKLKTAGLIEIRQRGAGRSAIVSRPHPRLPMTDPARAKSEQADPSARAKSEQADPSARAISEQADPSARAISEQADPSARAISEQADPSARAISEQADPSARAEIARERRGTGEVSSERASGRPATCAKCQGPTDTDAAGKPWPVCPGCNPNAPEQRRRAWAGQSSSGPPAGAAPAWRSEVVCGCGRAALHYKPGQDHIDGPLRELDAVCGQCHAEAAGLAPDRAEAPRGGERTGVGSQRPDASFLRAALGSVEL